MEADWKLNSTIFGEDYTLVRTAPELYNNSFIGVSSDGTGLLPTDDQLNQLVDNLCDTFSSSKTLSPDSSNNRGSLDKSTYSLTDSTISPVPAQSNNNVLMTESAAVFSQKKKIPTVPGKRATSNASLKMSMIRCLRYLECLRETRKSIEAYVRLQPHILTSIIRLPQSPTKVDRLIFEVDRERSRVLGLIATLDKTVQAFSAASTKDDLRCMLDKFRRTIIDVIKERHNEVDALESGANPNTGNHARKLALFINEVILLIREANTALWCLKQQVLTAEARKRCPGATSPAPSVTPVANLPSANGATPSSPNFEQPTRRNYKLKIAAPAQSVIGGNNEEDDGENADGRSPRETRGEELSATVARVPRTDVLPALKSRLSPSFSSEVKKSSATLLLAQQQRTVIFHQRYASSTLNSTRQNSTSE